MAKSDLLAAEVTHRLFVGCVVHPASRTQLDVDPYAIVAVDLQSGCITAREVLTNEAEAAAVVTGLTIRYGGPARVSVTQLGPHQFLLPGFIDTHVHASQFGYMGSGYDLPLLDWLSTHTFPEEARFADPAYAAGVYEAAVATYIRYGTTTAVYFATIHTDSCCALVDIVRRRGQRAWVGKVNMDRNSPDTYVETTEESLRETERFVEYVLGNDQASGPPLITPVITPRFVGSCSAPLMQGLAGLADRYDLPIQSHLSENRAEVTWTESLHPECASYTDIYATYGLLRPRSIMAHCVHPQDTELRQLQKHGVGVAHCPNSNFSLISGVADVRRLWRHGLAVGLGTDVAGGCSPSVIDAMRHASLAAKVHIIKQHQEAVDDEACAGCNTKNTINDEVTPLTAGELLYLATLGGAEAMGLATELGNFDVGKSFDALVCDLQPRDSPVVHLRPDEAWATKLEKFIFLGDDRNIRQVFVRGRKIHARGV
ncbi:hypothetical protein IWQ60_001342 [Tieghemiomyces parasiticus]|uniref:Guanine deaminase n=1 Tax=Tieghemiomyces parasiticus TaxID=78921 RepID=A0A9W8AH67_9FUNG|nr:hypothetical protein IWQ60_001342 [Tieghemiomyces parasiticus]